MKLATITSIQPDVPPTFTSKYGILYCFVVLFSDGLTGKVNSKSNPPPYKVGQRVGYEQTGEHGGIAKVKIDMNPQTPGAQEPSPVASAADSAAPAAAPTDRVGVYGATVGMSLNIASDLIKSSMPQAMLEPFLRSTAFSNRLYYLASDVIRVSRALEAGMLAPSAKERNTPPVAPVQDRSPTPPRVKPIPGPDGSVHLGDEVKNQLLDDPF